MKKISKWKKVLIVFSVIILLGICLFGFQQSNSISTSAKGEDNPPLPVAETQWVPACPPAYPYIIVNDVMYRVDEDLDITWQEWVEGERNLDTKLYIDNDGFITSDGHRLTFTKKYVMASDKVLSFAIYELEK